jgi:hypothetical protein
MPARRCHDIAGTMMALTMLVPVLAFVRKWRAKRELPTAA